MNNFINKLSSKGIHYSRYIASWANEGGTFYRSGLWDFKDWLRSMNLNEEEIEDISFIATNGKMELEDSAAKFIENSERRKNMK